MATCEFPIEENVKSLPSADKFMCIVFWVRKGVILLDFLEPGQTINSESEGSNLRSQARDEDNLSLAT